VDGKLFAALSDLRLSIANEQGVPAFVIFHNSTLTDLCMKRPGSPEELLRVSGVGRVKADRYGARFLAAIAEHRRGAAGAPGDAGNSPAGRKDDSASPEENIYQKFDPSEIEVSDEPVTVSLLADRINVALMQSGREKTFGRKINDWLVSEGRLAAVQKGGRNQKTPTEAGAAMGIITEMRTIRGVSVEVNLFTRAAQEWVINKMYADMV
jgi:ATP-dependent DNA helicase RecQ